MIADYQQTCSRHKDQDSSTSHSSRHTYATECDSSHSHHPSPSPHTSASHYHSGHNLVCWNAIPHQSKSLHQTADNHVLRQLRLFDSSPHESSLACLRRHTVCRLLSRMMSH